MSALSTILGSIAVGFFLFNYIFQQNCGCGGCAPPRGHPKPPMEEIVLDPQRPNPCDQPGMGYTVTGSIDTVTDPNWPATKYVIVEPNSTKYYMIDGRGVNIRPAIFVGNGQVFNFALRSSPYNANHYYVCNVSAL